MPKEKTTTRGTRKTKDGKKKKGESPHLLERHY
jgi:hypothetical protein